MKKTQKIQETLGFKLAAAAVYLGLVTLLLTSAWYFSSASYFASL